MERENEGGGMGSGRLKYPVDTKSKEVMVSPRLVQYLMAEFQAEYIADEPDKATKKHINKIMKIIMSGKWLIIHVSEMDAISFAELARWLCVTVACTLELRMMSMSYGELADAVRHDEKQVDLMIRAPYILIMFPELTSRVDWLRAKYFDILSHKTKSAILATTDITQCTDTIGEGIFNAFKKRGKIITL